MNPLPVLRELLKLFVDDGWLAVAILAIVLIAGVFATLMPQVSFVAGVILLCGCLGVLLVSVREATQR